MDNKVNKGENMDNQLVTKNYYSSIDGLRALCFLSVLLFHCEINGFQLGWAGVIVFFTISGFLITEILINSKQSQSYFKNFYIRRILRIFPIYYIVIVGVIFIFIVYKKSIPNNLIYQITYTQNMTWIFTNHVSDLQPMLAHTWTLAIEEQFYLVFPFMIWLIPTKHIPKLCALLIIFGISFRILMVLLNNDTAAAILLFSQIDTLALGAALTCYKKDLIKSKIITFLFRNSIVIGLCGIVSIIIYISVNNGINFLSAYYLFNNTSSYLSHPFTAQIYFFVALLSVGLIRKCYSNANLFNKILSNKVLIHLGKISYGLYLYHWVILVIIRKIFPSLNGIILVAVIFIVTYIASIISYCTIEKFFRNIKKKFA